MNNLQEPERQRAPRTKKCQYSESVGAKKIEYLQQFFNADGQLINFSDDNTPLYLKTVLSNLDQMDTCQHDERKHRAKFMCHFCYLIKGNKKKATECPHKNRTHHSRGLCKSCYQRTYYKVVTDL